MTDAKLPKESITKTFMESLRRAPDDKAIDAEIADRQAIVKKATEGVHGMGDERDGTPATEGKSYADELGVKIQG